MNPHHFLGMGGEKDIMVAGRNAVKQKVKELILAYGYAGRPRRWPSQPPSRAVFRRWEISGGRSGRGWAT